nr:hypothetical protein BaRGS_004197 [Batillaria attramentaria]
MFLWQARLDEVNSQQAALERDKKLLQQEAKQLKNVLETQKADLEKAQKVQAQGSDQSTQMQKTIEKLQAELKEKSLAVKHLETKLQELDKNLSEKERLAAAAHEKVGQLQGDLQARTK